MDETTRNLRQATLRALSHKGVQILREPRLFVASVSGSLGSNSLEVRVLKNVVELGCLENFANVADVGTPQALRNGAELTAALLEVEYAIKTDVARSVSLGMALAIADFLGIEASVMPSAWASGVTYPRTLQIGDRNDSDRDDSGMDAVYAPPPWTGRARSDTSSDSPMDTVYGSPPLSDPPFVTVYGSPSIVGGVLGSIANLFGKKGGR